MTRLRQKLRIILAMILAVMMLALPAAAHTNTHNHGYGVHGLTVDGTLLAHSSIVQCTEVPGGKLTEEWHFHYSKKNSSSPWVFTHEVRAAWNFRLGDC